MKSTGAHFHVIGLQNDAALLGPVFLQGKNEVLKGAGRRGKSVGHRMLMTKAKPASIATPTSCVLGFSRTQPHAGPRHAPNSVTGVANPGVLSLNLAWRRLSHQ